MPALVNVTIDLYDPENSPAVGDQITVALKKVESAAADPPLPERFIKLWERSYSMSASGQVIVRIAPTSTYDGRTAYEFSWRGFKKLVAIPDRDCNLRDAIRNPVSFDNLPDASAESDGSMLLVRGGQLVFFRPAIVSTSAPATDLPELSRWLNPSTTPWTERILYHQGWHLISGGGSGSLTAFRGTPAVEIAGGYAGDANDETYALGTHAHDARVVTWAQIQGKPDILTSVAWDDVTGKPDIPVNIQDMANVSDPVDHGFLRGAPNNQTVWTPEDQVGLTATPERVAAKPDDLLDGERYYLTGSETYDAFTVVTARIGLARVGYMKGVSGAIHPTPDPSLGIVGMTDDAIVIDPAAPNALVPTQARTVLVNASTGVRSGPTTQAVTAQAGYDDALNRSVIYYQFAAVLGLGNPGTSDAENVELTILVGATAYPASVEVGGGEREVVHGSWLPTRYDAIAGNPSNRWTIQALETHPGGPVPQDLTFTVPPNPGDDYRLDDIGGGVGLRYVPTTASDAELRARYLLVLDADQVTQAHTPVLLRAFGTDYAVSLRESLQTGKSMWETQPTATDHHITHSRLTGPFDVLFQDGTWLFAVGDRHIPVTGTAEELRRLVGAPVDTHVLPAAFAPGLVDGSRYRVLTEQTVRGDAVLTAEANAAGTSVGHLNEIGDITPAPSADNDFGIISYISAAPGGLTADATYLIAAGDHWESVILDGTTYALTRTGATATTWRLTGATGALLRAGTRHAINVRRNGAWVFPDKTFAAGSIAEWTGRIWVLDQSAVTAAAVYPIIEAYNTAHADEPSPFKSELAGYTRAAYDALSADVKTDERTLFIIQG